MAIIVFIRGKGADVNSPPGPEPALPFPEEIDREPENVQNMGRLGD
jgi:hypothetical protein